MPIYVAQIVRKGTVRDATACHDGNLVSVACHRAPLAAQPLATRAWKGPRATRWWMRWSLGTEGPLAAASALPRLLPCRVWKLVAHRALPGRRARHGKLSWYALSGLPGKLLLPGSCLLSLNTLFLDGSKGTLGDLGDHPASLCRGVLQLPVHKFGVLGYPYSSAPTGAPGPGPYTVPSAVGPGPIQGTGTRGLGHAKSCSISTALSITARVECGIVGEIMGGCLSRRPKRPPRPSL